MIKMIAGVLLLTSIFTAQLSAAQEKAHKSPSKIKSIILKDGNDGTAMNAIIGQDIELRLKANSTTGYSWDFDGSMDDHLKLADSKYVSDPHEKGLAGYGGTQIYHFKVLKSGDIMIALIYSRSWEKDKTGARRYSVTIHAK